MDGVQFSNTKFFEDYLGWTDILVEPHPFNFNLLKENRPKNKLFNCIISDNNGDEVKFIYYNTSILSAVSGVLSTLPKNNIKNYFDNDDKWQENLRQQYLVTEMIKTAPLSLIIKSSGFDHIDLFSLDVEGHELNVLNSYNWSIPINMFLIENGINTPLIKKIMLDKGYTFMQNVGPNSFFIHNEFINLHAL